MTHEPIPLRKPIDQFTAIALDAKASLSRNHTMLDLRAYWDAKAVGAALPCFRSLNAKGIPVARVRLLSLEDQAAIRSSDEAVEVLAKRYSIDPLIVVDIRAA